MKYENKAEALAILDEIKKNQENAEALLTYNPASDGWLFIPSEKMGQVIPNLKVYYETKTAQLIERLKEL